MKRVADRCVMVKSIGKSFWSCCWLSSWQQASIRYF